MIHRFKVDKLIRDKLPSIMRASKINVFERTMEGAEYLDRLKDKLLEEAKEVINTKSKKELVEELADLLEVMISIAKINEINFEQIQQMGDLKRSDKGGFDDRIYCDFVEIASDNSALAYYKSRSSEYPELKQNNL